ncbi:MAG: insulinase family protein, partial [Chloroflexota bacterium]|nr:insulinase family protein [Chloroflexota bacterium]
AAGGTLNATTWLDRTNYFETLPSHQLELGLWLEADRLANLLPAMTLEKLDNQREVVKNERRWAVDNQPYGAWDEKIQELLYPAEHPYHHSTIGSMDDLNAASLEDVGEFFATYYAPDNAVLSVVGDFEPAGALAMIERHFGPIAANPQRPPVPDTAIEPLIGAEIREVVSDRVPLPRVYAAYRIPVFGTDAFDALEVAVDLLGTGRASRLYGRLVRERQLAQDVSVMTFPIVGGAAVFGLWATARPGIDHEALTEAVLGEVDLLTNEGPSDVELERVRNLHAAGIESAQERISERADHLSMYACLFDQPERVNSEVTRYEAVDVDRVRSAMAGSLRADNRVLLTYLPAETDQPGTEEAA